MKRSKKVLVIILAAAAAGVGATVVTGSHNESATRGPAASGSSEHAQAPLHGKGGRGS